MMKSIRLPATFKITITNNQSTPSAAPHHQMLQLNLQTLRYRGGAVRPDCGNLRFYDSNMAPVYSWLESITNSTATFWLRIANAIPANGAITVFMVPQSYNTEFDGTYAGEAPQLSSTYGQYDNGANVFPFYDNFAGTTLSSKWTSTGGITYSVNNGFTATASGSYNDAITSSAGSIISAPSVIDFYGIIDASVIDCGAGSNNNVGTFIQTTGSNTFVQQHSNAGPSTNSGSITSLVTKEIYNLLIQSETSSTFSVNYGITVTPSTADAPVYPVPAMLISGNGSFSPAFFAQWYRTRAYPPNGVMPLTLISQWQSGGE